jgi:hypothetical protein
MYMSACHGKTGENRKLNDAKRQKFFILVDGAQNLGKEQDRLNSRTGWTLTASALTYRSQILKTVCRWPNIMHDMHCHWWHWWFTKQLQIWNLAPS